MLVLREIYHRQNNVAYQVFSDADALCRFYGNRDRSQLDIDPENEPDAESQTWKQIHGIKLVSTLHVTNAETFRGELHKSIDANTGRSERWERSRHTGDKVATAASQDWMHLGDETHEDGTVISRFQHSHTDKVEEVVLSAEEAKYVTAGEVWDRLRRQVGERRWQDDFAAMLSNMMNNQPRRRSVSLYPEGDTLFAILTISNQKQEIEISGMSKVGSITEVNDDVVTYDENWLLYETSRCRAYLKKGALWAGSYTLHKILATTNGRKIILESFGLLSRIRDFFRR